ncbi:T9SS type B sorting domain-containing protein [Flavobacterium haoranii]|uniref:Gliding motility-associated C-terminal domain-containing protein n=1 Tax=Flavobacterium haoranii TaxID=683124 RepID=A0A1M6M6K7_9FLAO|nr:T9SS type B sorting domain-containing protein [Flavobacterium haoranii]SHJ79068.1 gliding motility-associated C-terminal domain-containing protein [Flavobacterium haoranii]
MKLNFKSIVCGLVLILVTTITKAQCTTNVVACDLSTNPTFSFVTQSPASTSCLDLLPGNTVAYITTYVAQSGFLNMLINGNASTGFLDVAVFNVPSGMSPCAAIQNSANEIQCNYASNSNGCNQLGNAFACASSVPAPYVTAGQTLMIVVENWSGASTNFTIDLGNTANSAEFASPDATINPAGPFCVNDIAYQLTSVNNGGNWSGPGVTSTGLFYPSVAGVGIHTVNYQIGLGTACASAPESIQIEVKPSPGLPTVTSPVIYCIGDTATALSATPDLPGNTLNWYTTATGGTASATAPTPSTAVQGNFNYWVSQTNVEGCESFRRQITVVVSPIPDIPVVTVTPATCTSDGNAVISNFNGIDSYEFNPPGPVVDGSGNILGFNFNTPYEIKGDNGTCMSVFSSPFTIQEMLITPADPVIQTISATCSSDGYSEIVNYVSGMIYDFNPAGPTVDVSGNVLGMVFGQNYTVRAFNGDCYSNYTSNFSNDEMLAQPSEPIVLTSTPVSCSSNEIKIISNLEANVNYIFSPSGPTVDLTTGEILNMQFNTDYVVYAQSTISPCFSTTTPQFNIQQMYPTPSAAIITTINPTCTTDGYSYISNFDSTLNYTFAPLGPSYDTNGNITGEVFGTNYTLTVSNSNCSIDSNFTTNGMISTPSIVVTNNSPSICDGDMTNIVVTGLQTGETLNWIVNANEVNGLISGQGTSFTDAILTLFSGIETPRVVNIRFYADNGSCTSSFHDIDVTVNPRPDIMVSPNSPEEQTICSGETTNIEISSSYPNVNFTWEVISNVNGVVGASNGTGDTIAQTLSVSGTLQGVVVYRLHAFIGSCESANTIDFTVYVNPKPVYNPIITPTSICDGASINLNYSHPDTNITFGWDLVLTNADVVGGILSGVTTTNSLNLNQAFTLVDSLVSGQATFTVWVDLNGCKSDPFTATVDIHPNPQVQLQDGAICVQDGQVYQTYWLNAGVLPLGGDYEYEWFMVDTAGDISLGTTTTPYYEVVMAGDYYVVVTNVDVLLGTNCSGVSNTVTVIETNPATLANATVVVTEFFTGSGVVTITVTDGNGTLEYQLDEGEFQSSNVFTGVSAGPHTVTVVDTQGCTYFTIPVLVVDYPKFFTPNGDGYNDTWNIIGLEQENAKLYIFDRYGKLIKQINTLGANQGNGWDGTLNGKPLPSTDYWFSLEYEENGIMKEFKAHFSLKR